MCVYVYIYIYIFLCRFMYIHVIMKESCLCVFLTQYSHMKIELVRAIEQITYINVIPGLHTHRINVQCIKYFCYYYCLSNLSKI